MRKGEMGVGTLIIFIALLLVAAVAAGVLIQTAGSLQQRALSTGSQATGQIATSATVLEVSAEDGTNLAGVTNFSMIMKLAPGSEPIRLEAVTMALSTVDSTTTYLYSEASTATVNPATNNGTFIVEYLQEGVNNDEGLLVRGDVVRIDFLAQAAIGQQEDVRINFIPQIGTPTRIVFSTPDVMSTQRVFLYP